VGDLKYADFFAGNNEHRVVLTRILDLGIIWLNGRWEPLLQMTVNAFIFCVYACGLAYFLWDFLGRKNAWLVCLLLIPFFTLPFAGENATWGFNSQQYFVNIFGLLALAWLGFGTFGSWRWYCGCVAAVIGLFTMANGLLAPAAVGGLLVLRMIKNRRIEKGNVISLAAAALVFVIGAVLNVTKQEDHSLQAHSFVEFTAALTRDLSWPFYQGEFDSRFFKLLFPFAPCLIGLPLVLLLTFYLRPNFALPRAAEFLLVLALWSVLQTVVLAYGRANYGGSIPPSGYMDWLEVFVIGGVFSAAMLAQMWERHQVRNGILAFAYIALIFAGLGGMSGIVVNNLLMPTRMMEVVAEERVQRFAATGSESDFLEGPTDRPDPQMAMGILRDKDLQKILPAICVPPATVSDTPERLMPLSQWLQAHSPAILSVGLALSLCLSARELVGRKPGFVARNPAAYAAIVACVFGLLIVWSKHSVSRESVEYDLQEQIAANFKAAGNLKRAAIHEQKAEQLKQFEN